MVEPSWTCLRPVLVSQEFKSTLILIAPNPLNVSQQQPRQPHSSDSPAPGSIPHQDHVRPRALSTASTLSRRLSSFTISSIASSAVGSEDESSSPGHGRGVDTYLETLEGLIMELNRSAGSGSGSGTGTGSGCFPEVQFLTRDTQGKTVGDLIKESMELAYRWRKRRVGEKRRSSILSASEAGWSPSPGPGLHGSHPGSSTTTPTTVSPAESRRASVDFPGGQGHPGDGFSSLTITNAQRERRASGLPRSLSSVFGLTPSSAAETMETGEKGLRVLDAIVNVLPVEETAGSFQAALQNVLVTTTTCLPYLPTFGGKSSSPSTEIQGQETMGSRSRRGSAGEFMRGSNRLPQTLIHVLPRNPSSALVKTSESYLRSVFPQPAVDDYNDFPAPRAYLLGSKVLAQPMKRAADMSAVSGLGMILSGAVDCWDIDPDTEINMNQRSYLDDLKRCRFSLASKEKYEGSDQVPGRSNTPGPIQSTPIPRTEAQTIRALAPPITGIANNRPFDIPATPPLDFDNDTLASSFERSVRSSSPNPSNLPEPSLAGTSNAEEEHGLEKDIRKKKNWASRLFSKKP
jgi:hypothetical protein